MKDQVKYTHINLSPEEGKAITVELEALLSKYNSEMIVTPIINQNGTIGANVQILKKVELVPKDGVPSPFIDAEVKEVPNAPASEGGASGSPESTQG